MSTNFNVKPQEADETTTLALANVAAIAVSVFQNISGSAIANSINQSHLTQEAVAAMVTARVVKNLTNRSLQAGRQRGQMGA